MSTQKIKVEVSLRGRYSLGGVIEMTRKEYEDYCARLDGARGRHAGRLAEELANYFDMHDADFDDEEVEDFFEVETGEPA